MAAVLPAVCVGGNAIGAVYDRSASARKQTGRERAPPRAGLETPVTNEPSILRASLQEQGFLLARQREVKAALLKEAIGRRDRHHLEHVQRAGAVDARLHERL